MCSADAIVKTEALNNVVDLSSLAGGDGMGATAEKRAAERLSALPSPPPTPSKLRIKREDPDDILADLHCLFDGLNVNDSDDDSNSDSGLDTRGSHNRSILRSILDAIVRFTMVLAQNWLQNRPESATVTAPPSPRSKGFEFPLTKTYFCVRNRNYSYDEDCNVYSEDPNGNSTLIHWGQLNEIAEDIFKPSFHIDGIPFHFDFMGLYYSDQGMMYPVQTWQPEIGLYPFQQELGSGFGYGLNTFGGDLFVPNTSYGALVNFEQFDQPSVTNGTFCDTTQYRPQTKAEEEYIDQTPLNASPQGSMPWFPSSSTQSPIVSSMSRATSESYEQPLIAPAPKSEYPLFQPVQPQLEAEQELGWITGVQLWKHETKKIQAARHAPAVDKMDRRRCPECKKAFRRPSSLEDHLNTHSGDTPHVCPFERCKTAFPIKSHMKRHFATHRAGTLEEYSKGNKVHRSKSLIATYNAKALHTRRFRLA